MTISYTGDVANASGFGCFNKILIKWKGSVYKLIYKELLAYVVIYLLINIIYREVLVKKSECEINETNGCREWKESRELFESLVTYCNQQLTSIPLTFVLGFYVTLIVGRWWTQYNLLPWPDTMAILVISFLTGKEERQRLMRRNIIRYVLLSYCMATRAVSFRVKKRFPDLTHLVDAGLMREDEYKVLQSLDGKVTANKWFLPLVWASDICARGLAEGNIRPQTIRALIGELCKIREKLTGIMNHDWVSVPLVYTQVVTLAVYSYFVAALIGGQWISPESPEAYDAAYDLPVGKNGVKLDLFYPFFLTIQFAFYFGWLKVAETLINPFGEDDDDFELNRLIDRHCQVGYLIVEHDETPELLQDKYWDMTIPKDIPYTVAAEKFKAEEFVGSAEATLQIKESDKVYGDIYSEYNHLHQRTVNKASEDKSENADAHFDLEYGDYEDIGTPIPTKVNWLTRHLTALGSIRSNKSISSGSTYIYGRGLTKKQLHKSQSSLYDKISRKLSVNNEKPSHPLRGEVKNRKSSRQRSVSDTNSIKAEDLVLGLENKSFEKEEIDEVEESDQLGDDFNLILDKKLLETITENQNSPYSTQASHNPSRRMSAQSLFDSTRRGSSSNVGGVLKEPFVGPVLELFHENEADDGEDFEDVNDAIEKNTESLTVSSRGSSSSSGVESMIDVDAGVAGFSLGEGDSEVPDITVPNTVDGTDVPTKSDKNDNETKPNDIDSPFEVFNTVYV